MDFKFKEVHLTSSRAWIVSLSMWTSMFSSPKFTVSPKYSFFISIFYRIIFLTLLGHLLPASAQPFFYSTEHSHLSLKTFLLFQCSCFIITRDVQPEWRDHWTPGWEVKSPAQGAASRSRRTPLWNSTWNANKITAEVCKRLWHDVFQIDAHLMKFRHAWARSVYPQLVVNWYQDTTWKL